MKKEENVVGTMYSTLQFKDMRESFELGAQQQITADIK